MATERVEIEKHGPKPKKLTLASVARDALESADGDVQKGVKIMAARVRKNRALFMLLMDPLTDSACYSEIRGICKTDRREIWTAPNYSKSGNGARVKELAAGNLLMFQLPGGKLLGDARREEVEKAAHFYGEQADDMGHKARWLRNIAERVTGDKLVRQVLSDAQLRAMQAKTVRQ